VNKTASAEQRSQTEGEREKGKKKKEKRPKSAPLVVQDLELMITSRAPEIQDNEVPAFLPAHKYAMLCDPSRRGEKKKRRKCEGNHLALKASDGAEASRIPRFSSL